MIFHSANNLRKRKRKEKEKKKKKKKKKRKKKKMKKNKRGHKRNSIKPHAITMTWSIQFKHGQVLLN
jgi:sRNA-binding protein